MFPSLTWACPATALRMAVSQAARVEMKVYRGFSIS